MPARRTCVLQMLLRFGVKNSKRLQSPTSSRHMPAIHKPCAVAHLRIVATDARFRTEEGTLMAATATPLADPNKFTTIAHGTHRYLSPLSAAKAESLIQRLAVAPGQRVLDVGCGKAGFLLDLLAAAQARGVGVDTNPAFIAAATAAARERGLSERAEFVNARLQDTIDSTERFDAVV
ncbi:MAG: methyltransferase domain-containing protein, partial [Betaproteobacteria bacterium]